MSFKPTINYTIPSDNWEQQQAQKIFLFNLIIPYQAKTGNNNRSWELINRVHIIPYQAITGNNNLQTHRPTSPDNYTIPSDNWEQQQRMIRHPKAIYYTIPSDNWEQQLLTGSIPSRSNYTIPSDNWEQQRGGRLKVCL